MTSSHSSFDPNTGTARPGGTGQLAGRTVARIGYGAMQLERLHEDRATGLTILRRAVELGIDHIDTAQFYGDGFVNDLIREAIRAEDGVLVASKVGATPDPGGPYPMRPAQRPEQLRADVEAPRPSKVSPRKTSSTSTSSSPTPETRTCTYLRWRTWAISSRSESRPSTGPPGRARSAQAEGRGEFA